MHYFSQKAFTSISPFQKPPRATHATSAVPFFMRLLCHEWIFGIQSNRIPFQVWLRACKWRVVLQFLLYQNPQASGPLRLPVHIGFWLFGRCYLKIMIHLFSAVAEINIYTYFIDLRLNMFRSAAHGLLLKILSPQLNIDHLHALPVFVRLLCSFTAPLVPCKTEWVWTERFKVHLFYGNLSH